MNVYIYGSRRALRALPTMRPIGASESNLKYLLLRLMHAGADAVRFDHVIVADCRPHRGGIVARMDRKVHAGLNRHGFVGSDHRALDHVVTLAVGVEPDLRRKPVLLHIGV